MPQKAPRLASLAMPTTLLSSGIPSEGHGTDARLDLLPTEIAEPIDDAAIEILRHGFSVTVEKPS